MVILEATVLPLVFLSSAFSTRPVEPSKYRGIFSFTSCAMILLLGVMFAARSSSKLAILYMTVLSPVIVGIIPTEKKFRIALLHTRLMGLSYAYLARLQGDTSFIKVYIWTEWLLRLIHLHLDTVYVIVNQAHKWVKLTLLGVTAQILRVIDINWLHTGITAVYLLSMTYRGIPGKDTKIISWIRSLKLPIIYGLEEYMVPLIIRSVPVILSVVIMLTALHDSNCWMLCSLVWYTNVFVRVLQTAEWYWSPVAALRAHRAQYPGATHRERQWTGPCSICWDNMEQYTAQSTPCGHVFHSKCLRLSLNTVGYTCPLCRYPLPESSSDVDT